MKKYIFGAYGTNNIGDDAIFDGANTMYNNKLTPLYINKANRPNSMWYADVLTGKLQLDNTTHNELIMGGGGLLHCRGAVEDYHRMGIMAKQAGLKFTIQRIGTEGQSPEYDDATEKLLSIADGISVRTTTSKEIINNLGFECKVEKDFVYSLNTTNVKPIKHFNNDRKTIMFALTSTNDEQLEKISDIIFNLIQDFNILLIPHSRAYMSYKNNDVVTGEKIWSNIRIDEGNKELHFKNLPYNSNVGDVLSTYKGVDLVVGTRFHSFIFSDITDVPALGLVYGLKNSSYFKDNTNSKHHHIEFDTNIINILNKITNILTP